MGLGASPAVPAPGARQPASVKASEHPGRLATSDRTFLVSIYFAALSVRLLVCTILYASESYLSYFAGDAWTYDFYGWALARAWTGDLQYTSWVDARVKQTGINGMYYWVAAIYYAFGRSQWLAAAIGIVLAAFIPVLVYKISFIVYRSR